MSTMSFNELAKSTRQGWSQQAHDVYSASKAAFPPKCMSRWS